MIADKSGVKGGIYKKDVVVVRVKTLRVHPNFFFST
jgi:hypothetical protein